MSHRSKKVVDRKSESLISSVVLMRNTDTQTTQSPKLAERTTNIGLMVAPSFVTETAPTPRSMTTFDPTSSDSTTQPGDGRAALIELDSSFG